MLYLNKRLSSPCMSAPSNQGLVSVDVLCRQHPYNATFNKEKTGLVVEVGWLLREDH